MTTHAQRMMLAAGVGIAGEFAFISNHYDSVDRTTYTFSGVSFGAAHTNRRIIISVFGGGQNRTISSVTIGGVSATNIVSLVNSNHTCAIYLAEVPAGTSGSVVVTFSGAQSRCFVGVYRSTFNVSTAQDTDTDGTSGTTQNGTVSTRNGGFVIAAGGSSNPSATHTWSGGVTEDFDDGESESSFSGASGPTDGSNVSPHVVRSASSSNVAFVVASF